MSVRCRPWFRKPRFPAGKRQAVGTCLSWVLAALLCGSPASAAPQDNSLQQHYVWDTIDSHKTGSLFCPPQQLAVALTYIKGRTVDSLHFHCRAPQFAGSRFNTWTAPGTTQVVGVGGQGGGQRYDMVCPEGMAISGLRGVNRNWGGHWLLASISIECATITQKNPWKVWPKVVQNYRDEEKKRIYLFAGGDTDNYNNAAPFIISAHADKSGFNFECHDTPIMSVDVRLAEWKLFMGNFTDVIHGVRWDCF